jgi:ElaB/YqjD/DUF883 family membrane-anchored ribosome-binding protein
MTQTPYEAGRQEGIAGQASGTVQDAASAAQEKASELRDQGSARLRDQIDRRSTDAGTQARSIAEALRHSGSELETQGKGGAAQFTRQAADRIDGIGSYLEQKSGDEVMRDFESFARRRPWMLAGLGMLAGIAAARFVKASSDERYSDYRRSSQQWQTTSRPAYPALEQTASSETAVPGQRSDDPLSRDPYAGTTR